MLKDRLWLTEDTLVRTDSGWDKVKNCSKFETLIGYDDSSGNYIGVQIKEFNKFNYSGIISSSNTSEVSANYYASTKTSSKEKLQHYEGFVYNLITDNNTIITTVKKDDKYSILPCQN